MPRPLMTEIGRSPGSNRGRSAMQQFEYQKSNTPQTKGRIEKGQGAIPPETSKEETRSHPDQVEDEG